VLLENCGRDKKKRLREKERKMKKKGKERIEREDSMRASILLCAQLQKQRKKKSEFEEHSDEICSD